jgi:hypothetical protein
LPAGAQGEVRKFLDAAVMRNSARKHGVTPIPIKTHRDGTLGGPMRAILALPLKRGGAAWPMM